MNFRQEINFKVKIISISLFFFKEKKRPERLNQILQPHLFISSSILKQNRRFPQCLFRPARVPDPPSNFLSIQNQRHPPMDFRHRRVRFRSQNHKAYPILIPVSYTHLDVYKRQLHYFASLRFRPTLSIHYCLTVIRSLDSLSGNYNISRTALIFVAYFKSKGHSIKEDLRKLPRGNRYGIIAVSYTHLDVYKRQVQLY